MKNLVFAVFILFAVVVQSNTVLANNGTEYEKALKYYNSGKYREAVDLFADYVKKRPDPSAYYYMGYASYKLRKYGEATEYFQQAFLIDPNFSLDTNSPAENPLRKKTPGAP